MKKTVLILMSLVLALLCCAAAADTQSVLTNVMVSGDNSGSTTFYVKANSSYATLELSAQTGRAEVVYNNYGSWVEDLYGFYRVTISGNGTNETFLWVPSADASVAAYHKDWHTSSIETLTFRTAGVYTVTIKSVVASDYLDNGYVRHWNSYAYWYAGNGRSCTASYSYPQYYTPTATPYAARASQLSIYETRVNAGSEVTGYVSRYSTNVTHSIEWVHQNGSTYTQYLGSSYGSISYTIPYNWPTGYVYATLITYSGSREVGRSTASVYVQGSSTAKASSLTLYVTRANPGETINGYIQSAGTGLNHTIVWQNSDGSQVVQNYGSNSGYITFTVPYNWRSGFVTATITTYSGSTRIGSSSTGFYIYSSTPTAAPTVRPTARPTARPTESVNVSKIKSMTVYPTGGERQKHLGNSSYQIEGLTNSQFNALTDFSRTSVYQYTSYDSCTRDGIPELTFFFDQETVSSVWFRIGNQKNDYSYEAYARPYQFKFTIYTSQGVYEKSGSVADAPGFQQIKFGETFTDVYQIDVEVIHYKVGYDDTRYIVCLSDIAFNY